MANIFKSLFVLALMSGTVGAQDFLGPASVGSSEPLFEYDDPEPWKHGYLKIMPYHGGYHKGLPYNYHHVFSQTQTSVGWGMPHGMPYSQQWWHKYEAMADPGRAQTEPNGYYGYITPQPMMQQPQMQWAQTPRPVQQQLAAPVVYEQPLRQQSMQQVAPAGFAAPEIRPGLLNGPALQ